MARDGIDQLNRFLAALYEEHDLIELRPIEIWNDPCESRRRSKVIRSERAWLRPAELVDRFDHYARLNLERRANLFMGVNPRLRVGRGSKADVGVCRSLWADMDEVSPEMARWRCQFAGIPDPSILIDSGSGVHMYWLLDHAVDVSQEVARRRLESRVQCLQRSLACDATSDVNRLLRLPGFYNVKDARVGQQPALCRIIQCHAARRFELKHFPLHAAKTTVGRSTPGRTGTHRRGTRVPNPAQAMRVVGLLEANVRDRSRRDFRVVCELVRLGMNADEIWALVASQSKFATNGIAYFRTTLRNAIEVVERKK